MTPVELSRTVLRAVRCAVDVGELSVSVPASAVVTPPGPGGCGDYATNIALRLAGPAGRPAPEVAEILRPYIARDPGVADVTVTGPGFLNITLAGGALADLVEVVLEQGTRYGYGDTLAGQVVELRVPYDTRAEIVADTLVRIVATQGGRVEVRHLEPVNLRPVPAPEDPAPLGHDATRWALLHPAPHDRPRISADHLLQRESNPLFRVRYAHARTRALRRNAATLGYTGAPFREVRPAGRSGVLAGAGAATGVGAGAGLGVGGPGDARRAGVPPRTAGSPFVGSAPAESGLDIGPTPAEVDRLLGPTPAESDLLTALAEYPHALRLAARHRAPDRLARHLVVTADAVLGFQHVVLPLGDEKPSAAHRARLALAEAAGTVLAGGLSLLGISAPEHL
ncbi:ArgS-related anticodon-binding protein NrtL [Streptomyces sp. NBC_00151]|uniref:ArgS-related anticodon-binding protein NrtL n=1 Tax=Streptomyces sp. NBC_00151 TaxID=2975669 RepID=UPI002DD86352|nr:DALR anticodon-binding domain-containing protein [Streptomyces sp. NBC_00151]WRZ39426.1 DALR anticodon-binding domain-containing protein [Streptomyces sp. NBC_00151]